MSDVVDWDEEHEWADGLECDMMDRIAIQSTLTGEISEYVRPLKIFGRSIRALEVTGRIHSTLLARSVGIMVSLEYPTRVTVNDERGHDVGDGDAGGED